MNYFFENQTKQNPGRSKSCECVGSKQGTCRTYRAPQLLPLSVGTLKTKYRGFYKGFRRLSKRAEIFFFKEDRVQTIVDERIQAIAKKILKRRYTVH